MADASTSVLLVQLAFIVGAAALFRWGVGRLRQPGVLGELTLGILFGPSLLGWLWPGGHAWLFPAEGHALLEALSTLGLVLFMYVAGAGMRWTRGDGRAVGTVAIGGLVVPLAAGVLLALAAPAWFFDGAATLSRVGIVAVVLTVSALPVLARILSDVDLLDRPVGRIVMGAGTVDDVVGWTLLTVIVGAGAAGLTGNIAGNLVLVAALVALAIAADRALPRALGHRLSLSSSSLFVGLVVAIFGAAALTHAAGLHAVVGPFIVGALVSRHPMLRDYAETRLRGITLVLLLPAFFVLAGADVNVRLLAGPTGLAALAAVVVVASLGKVLGCYAGARAAGLAHRESLEAGALMNARGAVGLVVAKVGLDEGLLAPQGFAVLVLMILVTTLFAPIALQVLARGRPQTQVTPWSAGLPRALGATAAVLPGDAAAPQPAAAHPAGPKRRP